MHNLIWNFAIAAMVLSTSYSYMEIVRNKRSQFENFNVLLSLYKINPLNSSKIYKTFSKQKFLPSPKTNVSTAGNININKLRAENIAKGIDHLKQKEKINYHENNQQYESKENENSKSNTKDDIHTFSAENNQIERQYNELDFATGSLESNDSNVIPDTHLLRISNTTPVLQPALNTNEMSAQQIPKYNPFSKFSNIYNANDNINYFKKIDTEMTALQNIDNFHKEIVVLR